MARNSSTVFKIALIATGILCGLIVASSFDLGKNETPRPPVLRPTSVVLGSEESPLGLSRALEQEGDAFVRISDEVVPTVVTIQSTRFVSSEEMERFHSREDFFRFKIPREFRQQGSGSGIIVTNDGYILTNVHVVDKAQSILVTLADNREFEARMVGLDPLTEVAVIKIDGEDLPVARLGNSERVRVGEWVLAIGNPLELTSSVTAGIISAKERQIGIIRDTFSVESFLQTDAAINPGNSGGALVNMQGEVIGVNTAIATETGYSAGFGFAIPINLARRIMRDLIVKGVVERAYLGIAMQNIDEKSARALSLPKPMGIFVDKVLDDSPAYFSGLEVKDVILAIDDVEVNRSNQVQAIIAKKQPGEAIALTIKRREKEFILDVTLGMRETEVPQFTSVDQKKPSFDGIGIEVEDLTRETAAALGYRGPSGARIVSVGHLSPGEESGLAENDIIIEIDDEAIQSKEDFERVIAELDEGSVSIFTVRRVSEEFHIFVEAPSR